MPHDNTSSRPDLPDLSNEDVAVLYEIINVSSQAPDIHSLPFRAIFAAYDEVLGKHGISPAHDQLYLRFLFRLGERLGQDGDDEEKDLFTEFEALLLELGIKIEIGSATGSIFAEDEMSVYHENTEYGDSKDAFAAKQTPPSRRRERRASFSTVLDSAKEASRAERDLPESPASISRLQDTSDGFGSRPFREKRQRTNRNETFPDYSVSSPIRSGLEGKAKGSNKQLHNLVRDHQSDPYKGFQARNLSSGAVEHGQLGQSVPNFHIYEDSLDKDTLPRKVMDKSADKQVSKQHELLRAKMQRDAETLEYFRFQKRIGNVFRKWHITIQRKQHQRNQLLQAAIQYDHRELVRQAWNELRHKYKEKKQAAEAKKRTEEAKRQAVEQERYLVWREENAAKARDVYLVAKAFSHWANFASERAAENAVARRHLLRLRYFNAWKEVTAVNELKVCRAIFQKFLNIWHRKFQDVAAQQSRVPSIHERSLAQAAYSNWFRHFCERKASAWRTGMLAQKYFLKWVVAIRIRAEQRLLVIKHRQEHIQRRQLRRFVDLTQHSRLLEKDAEIFRHQRLVSKAFSEWKQAGKLAPSVNQVSRIINRRVASTAFAKLRHRHNAEQQAQEIDRRQLLRNVWTTWNNNLRVKTMQHQINDRLVMRVLYNWVLMERGALMRRVHDDRLQKQVLYELLKQREMGNAHSVKAGKQASQLREQNLKKMVWKLWLGKSNQIKSQLGTADRIYQPRVKSQIMHQWHSIHEHLVQISRWSIEATFYLRGQRSIRRWQAAAKESQSQKRREAYAIVKREYRKNLAMRAFQEWQYRSNQIKVVRSIEQEFQTRRAKNMSLTVLRHWGQRTIDRSSTFSQAAAYDSNKLTVYTLADWASRARMMSRQTVTAIEFYNSCVQKKAYDSLRRLQLKIFELQSHDATALSVLTWTSKRRARGLLRAWAERAASRRLNKSSIDTLSLDSGPLLPHGTSLISLAKTPRTNRRNQPGSLPFQTQPKQAILPPQTPFYNVINTLPNHLSTPSHRAARAKALSQAQTPLHPHPISTETADHASQGPTTTSPPSDESSHQTTNTSPTQLSESKTTHDDQSFPNSAESSRIFPQTPLQTTAQLPLTDIQPQRRRFPGQTSVPIQGENVHPPSTAGSNARRSLFPNAKQMV